MNQTTIKNVKGAADLHELDKNKHQVRHMC